MRKVCPGRDMSEACSSEEGVLGVGFAWCGFVVGRVCQGRFSP